VSINKRRDITNPSRRLVFHAHDGYSQHQPSALFLRAAALLLLVPPQLAAHHHAQPQPSATVVIVGYVHSGSELPVSGESTYRLCRHSGLVHLQCLHLPRGSEENGCSDVRQRDERHYT
jgi:hypothetical protein